MMDPAARKYLQEEMDKFLAGEDFAKAEGYVPPKK
jgi:Fe-S cluster biosynthesis and repair protein YggX